MNAPAIANNNPIKLAGLVKHDFSWLTIGFRLYFRIFSNWLSFAAIQVWISANTCSTLRVGFQPVSFSILVLSVIKIRKSAGLFWVSDPISILLPLIFSQIAVISCNDALFS